MTTQFDQVSVLKQANIYFDGKCVSHTVLFADGSKKTLGVIFPVSNQTVLQTSLTMKEEKFMKLETNTKVLPEEGTAVKLVIEAPK